MQLPQGFRFLLTLPADAQIKQPGAHREAVIQVRSENVSPLISKTFILSMKSQNKGAARKYDCVNHQQSFQRGTPETFRHTKSIFTVSARPLEVATRASTCVKSHPTLCFQLELLTFKTVQKLSVLPFREK